MQPVYGQTEGLSNKTIVKAEKTGSKQTDEAGIYACFYMKI